MGARNLVGIYRAKVEDNMDPLRCGRVRVRVPMLHGLPGDGIPSSSLPWASMCTPSAGFGYGSFIVPEVGEYVFVMFEDADSNKPVYLGSSYGSGSTLDKVYGNRDGNGEWKGVAGIPEVPMNAQRDDPTRKVVYKSPKGSSIEVDEENNEESICITDPLGQVIKMESCLKKGVQHKRVGGDAEDNEYIPPHKNEVSTKSRVLMMDYFMNKLEMCSDEKGSVLSFVDNKGNGFKITPESDGVTLCMNNSVIQIDSNGNVQIVGKDTVNVKAREIRFNGDFTIIGS